MEPMNWIGASVDRGVLRRLARLDKRLRVTFSPYALDTFTGRPIECRGAVDTETGDVHWGPVVDPAFFLWRKDNLSSHHFFVQSYPLGLTGGFGHLEVLKLEADLARFHSPAEAWRIVTEAHEHQRAARTRAHRQRMVDKARANATVGKRILAGDERAIREARSFSYSGQGSRLSGAERTVVRDNREVGIEE